MNIFKDCDIMKITTVIEDQVDWMFGDPDDEIGSSDVSACVRSVIRDLGFDPDFTDAMEMSMIRTCVMNKIGELHD